jgi:hypothetical protein
MTKTKRLITTSLGKQQPRQEEEHLPNHHCNDYATITTPQLTTTIVTTMKTNTVKTTHNP